MDHIGLLHHLECALQLATDPATKALIRGAIERTQDDQDAAQAAYELSLSSEESMRDDARYH